MKKLVREGKVAVLVSYGFGAGWYSWHEVKELLFDPRVVEMVENKASYEEIEEYCEQVYGKENYYGGIEGLHVEWIPIQTMFQIREYDGAESIEYNEKEYWIVA